MIEVIETHGKRNEYDRSYSISFRVDGKSKCGMNASDSLSECPEDATLGRDLGFIFEAKEIFRLAYEAGKNGEEVTFAEKFLNEDEEEITKEEFYK